jgi:hypothetical protein
LGGAVAAAIVEALRIMHAHDTESFIDMNSPRKFFRNINYLPN